MPLFQDKLPERSQKQTHESLRSLALRLNLNGKNTPRVISFIAARPGEGTSTLSLSYAMLLAQEMDEKLLLIDASPTISNEYIRAGFTNKSGIIDAVINDKPIASAVQEIAPNLHAARWTGKLQYHSQADRVMQNMQLWESLREEYGYIVIDTPSLQKSFDGVVLAAKADCSVLVVEAEATPAPVTQHLRDVLLGAGAKIAGIVLTKRRYYIPQKVYTKL